jgi:CubicO group peptidase (beta-lactamase class C family)
MAQSINKSEKVDEILAEFNKPDSPGASVIIIKNGKILYSQAYGLANLEDRIPITTKTNFRLASLTKEFTAMAIMILVERKKLTLDTHLTDIFPDFPAYGKPISIRHLLNHTSGLLDYEDLVPKGTTIPLIDRDVLWILEQQDKTNFPPGTKYEYSNSGYATLACIVEKVSGETFASFLKKNIFDPLKMYGTSVYERGFSTIPNRAYGYSASSTEFTRTDQSLTSAVQGDGGIYSSVNDLYKWDQALYTTKLVSRKMLQQAFTPGQATQHGDNASYGFGWDISQYRGKRCFSHGGSSIGFRTTIIRLLDDKFTVVLLTNRSQAETFPLTQKIIDLYLFD